MIPVISSLYFISTLKPLQSIVSVRTYISKNINNYNDAYYICDEIDDMFCSDHKAKSFIDFLAYLITVDVEYTVSGNYFIFKKRNKNDNQRAEDIR